MKKTAMINRKNDTTKSKSWWLKIFQNWMHNRYDKQNHKAPAVNRSRRYYAPCSA